MKYHVKNENGELVVPSYQELRTLYARQFISDDDQIRREGNEVWVRAGEMRDLKAIKPRPWFRGSEFAWLAIAICVLSLIMILLFRR